MIAKYPEEICRLFQLHMSNGDLHSLLELYDVEAVFLTEKGETLKGHAGIREALAPLARNKAHFYYHVVKVIQSGPIALMHTDWEVTSPQPMSSYAMEVAKKQADGSWRWLIGDPFTVGRRVKSAS